MPRNPPQRPRRRGGALPRHPIVSETLHRDTLDRVAHVIALLEQLDLSDGLTPSARTGLYWIHSMLADAVRHVSDALGEGEAEGARKA